MSVAEEGILNNPRIPELDGKRIVVYRTRLELTFEGYEHGPRIAGIFKYIGADGVKIGVAEADKLAGIIAYLERTAFLSSHDP